MAPENDDDSADDANALDSACDENDDGSNTLDPAWAENDVDSKALDSAGGEAGGEYAESADDG